MTYTVSSIFFSRYDTVKQEYATRENMQATDASQQEEHVSSNGNILTEDQQKRINELKQIDRDVRAHEAAHAAAAGGLARGTSYRSVSGPDGKQYAVGGEVKIDVSPISGNAQATISKMQIVRRAALAPIDPSGQDRSVASTADSIEAQARSEIANTKAARTIKNSANAKKAKSPTDAYVQKPQQSSYSAVEMCRMCQSTLACQHLATGQTKGVFIYA